MRSELEPPSGAYARRSTTSTEEACRFPVMAEPYVGRLSDLVGDLSLGERAPFTLECRHFLGGAALYIDGTICASLTPVGLALKLPATAREAMFEDGPGHPLRYFDGGKVKKEYVVLSQSVVANSSEVKEVFRASFRYVRGE